MNDPPDPGRVVYTCKQVTEDGFWIQYVFHDQDGTWQAYGMDGPPDDIEESRIVRFDTMLAMDETIRQLSDLPRGWQAWRLHVDAPWERGVNGQHD